MKDILRPTIAIVGMGGILPDAPTLEQFWDNIKQGRSASHEVSKERWILDPDDVYEPQRALDKVYSKYGCYIHDFHLNYDGLNVDSTLLDQLDPVFHVALYAGRQALHDTQTQNIDLRRAGIFIGNIALPTDKSSALTAESLGRWFEENIPGITPSIDAATHPLNRYAFGIVSGIVAQALGLGGGSFAIDAACASSLYALKYAVDELQSGRADLMLTGGVSRPDCLYTQMGFCQLNALSPTCVCAPFDAKGNGLVVGEGAGIVALKRLDDALRDQDRIYAVIRGIGLSNDRQGALLAPDSVGQVRAMQAAYEQAKWSPHDVDLIECHGTGTPVGDGVEFGSLQTLWQNSGWQPRQCIIGSVKSNVGHLLTGAGAAGLLKTLLALKHQTLPPTANFYTPSPKIDLEHSPFSVLSESCPWNVRDAQIPRRAAVSAFGFGGINAHVLLEEWSPKAVHSESRITVATHRSSHTTEAIAVVGMDAYFGPWDSLRKFQEHVLGNLEQVEPAYRKTWWGIADSEWFKYSGIDRNALKGFYIDALTIPFGKFRIPPKELEETLPQQVLMLQVASGALEDVRSSSVLSEAQLDALRLRTGVFIGLGLDLNTTNFSFRWSIQKKARQWAAELELNLTDEEFDAWVASLRESFGPPLTANRTVGALGGIVASRIAREFRLGGPSFVLSSEDNSGLRAIEVAVRSLQQEDIDQAIVGAVDLFGDIRCLLNTHALRPFSSTSTTLPFDLNADGSIPGEGAAAVILKRLSDAQRDGDKIYAFVKGIGSSSGQCIKNPGEQTYIRALNAAYRDAHIGPETLSYIETHGSGDSEEDRMEAGALQKIFAREDALCGIGSVKADIGHTGAAAGLASFVKTCLCLYQEILPSVRTTAKPESSQLAGQTLYLPAGPQYWLHNRADGPRRAGVSSCSVDGNCTHVVLEGHESRTEQRVAIDRAQPTGARPEALFAVEADSPASMISKLEQLQTFVNHTETVQIEALARLWWHQQKTQSGHALGGAFVARSTAELLEQINPLKQALTDEIPPTFPGGRIFYDRDPVGMTGQVAFVFPGSGNHYSGMGREIAVQWPEILRKQDVENQYLHRQYVPELLWNSTSLEEINRHPRDLILGQVAYDTMMTDLLRSFGVHPQAVIGYSLGESSGLFALRAWMERDEMLQRMVTSSLFTNDLAGAEMAARRAWKLEEHETVDWMIAAVQCSSRAIQEALAGRERVYLLIINTPDTCVIGGNRLAVMGLVHDLSCQYHPLYGVSTAHCEVLTQVAESYRQLHWFGTTQAPEGIRFYSGAWGCSYDVTPDSAADAILAQASTTINFPAVIEQAYADGVRVFVEIGPGTTCTRMIGEILVGRPHVVRSTCTADFENTSTILRLLGMLIAERIPVDLAQLYGRETHVSAYTVQTRDATKVRTLTIPTGGIAFQLPPTPARKPALEAEERTEHVSTVVSQTIPEIHPKELQRQGPEQSVIVQQPAQQTAAPLSELMQQFSAVQSSYTGVHEAYLRYSQGITESFSKQTAFQMELLETAMKSGVPVQFRKDSVPPNSRREGFPLLRKVQEMEPSCVPFSSQEKGVGGMSSENGVLAPECTQSVFMTREQCLEFAVGSIARVLGEEFADVDRYPTRVRLPDEPLMLVDRILLVKGEPRSLTYGTVVTEHDILPRDWYLDCGRIPTCIAVESGQADLFLSGYLGIDFQTKGLAVYRLLDAIVTFHNHLPGPGEVIRYEINIEHFFRQGETYLFHFNFEGTVDGKPFLSMRDGCAGFFTQQELDAGQGLVFTEMDLRPISGKKPNDWQDLVPVQPESYPDEQIEALRAGNLRACFGPSFAGLPLRNPLRLPGGRMHLIDRVLQLDPTGGRYGLGQIVAEADIHPNDWFLTCHFVDDQVMPGTLMYECSLHTLRVLLMRMGWVGEQDEIAWEPVPEVPGQLKCRGQVIATTQKVSYEISVKELGFRPAPYAIADAVMYADGKPIVRMLNMSLQLSGMTRNKLQQIWNNRQEVQPPVYDTKPAIFDYDRILAFAVGKPSEAFGDQYAIFDHDRIIARLPGPPYQFLDRITGLQGEPWEMTAGKVAEAQYDVPSDAWYFAANRQPIMPFSVLLEVALQPCGWLAAYAGSALTSTIDLSFRNLGGKATQLLSVTPETGTLTTTVHLTDVSQSGGMIIQHYMMDVRNSAGQPVYEGTTYFGFFSKVALSNQVGLREAQPYEPTPEEQAQGESFPYPREAPFPESQLRMLDHVSLFVPDGGPYGLGCIRGIKRIVPDEWFFKAHFYQDPVWPGSLGLEAFLQLLKVTAIKRWGWQPGNRFETMALQQPHQWTYRGQVIPTDREVTVQAVITQRDDVRRFLEAEGVLIVDGRIIYQMEHFTLMLLNK